MKTAANRRLLIRLSLSALLMFGFGFLLVPFYKAICEATGINRLVAPAALANTQVDPARTLVVEFDANAFGLPWRFRPLLSSLKVHPGELSRVSFEITNNSPRPATVQAIPSYAPAQAGRYFLKLECFCFSAQRLAPGETRVMPVVFVVDPSLPRSLQQITLSYTVFEVEGAGVVTFATPTGGRS
ncbi:MAG: cytochrome c oxidase assembly protein [Zoogloea sp.]|nr:cytochrome c oxidase assembly protein [Zoogloea sp.]